MLYVEKEEELEGWDFKVFFRVTCRDKLQLGNPNQLTLDELCTVRYGSTYEC
jgi:hypothetical protein